MAYTNFLGKETYVAIERVDYSPTDKGIYFFLGIYSDRSRTCLLARKEHQVSGSNTIQTLKGRINEFPSPDSVKRGETYLIRNPLNNGPSTCRWLIAERNNDIVDINDPNYFPTLGWTCWMVGGHERFYMEAEGKYYRLSDMETAELIQIWPNDDIRVWNQWFSKPVVNILKQCYLYLKSLPEYADAIEC